MNEKGVLRFAKERNNDYHSTFFLTNAFIYSLYQELIRAKNKNNHNLEIKIARGVASIQYKQFSNLFFVIGRCRGHNEAALFINESDNIVKEKHMLLIYQLAEKIDKSFNMKLTEKDFIYEHKRISAIVDSTHIV